MGTVAVIYLILGIVTLLVRSPKIIKRLNEKQESDEAKSFDGKLALRKVALTFLFWPYYAYKMVKEDEQHDH